jgi:hypothetical protein
MSLYAESIAEIEIVEERRAEPRYPAELGPVTLESNIFLETVKLINLGRSGFSVRTNVAYPSGSPLVIHLPGIGAKAAQAVWFSRNRLGARFLEPLNIDCLVSLT